jgi:3-deoxy-manno-octulosonate cytidylyltransferase (CMP-KDO synthetase)
MGNTAIIIPSRLAAKRLPNKPLLKINGIPIVVHTMNRAKESNVGDVFVATPDLEIAEIIEKNNGKVILTQVKHLTGTDRIYEAYITKVKQKVDLIINLQGDMPNIKSSAISKLEKLTRSYQCDIGTLGSIFKSNDKMEDPNIVKVEVNEKLEENSFSQAKDFFREKKFLNNKDRIYHHLGIYAFTSTSLTQYVKLPRSQKELERNLEQMRAMDNNLIIKVGLSDSAPLGIDTEEDLKKVIKEMS